MGGKCSKRHRQPKHEEFSGLASETAFQVNEVEALYELFKKLSSSVIRNGCIQKDELQLALFRNSKKQNLFSDRIFDLFDLKQNGQLEFAKFVRALSIFHPKTPQMEKVTYAFRLYDLRQTGFIEREELKEMVVALLSESDLTLTNDMVEEIVNKTFSETDTNGDGRIDMNEWKEYVAKNPSVLKNMTIPYLIEGVMISKAGSPISNLLLGMEKEMLTF